MNYFNIMHEYLDKKQSLSCVPVNGKAPFFDNWQSMDVNHDVIDSWEESFIGKTTGVGFRIGQHNIGCMDIDTDDVEHNYRIDEIMDLSNICTKRGMKGKSVFFRFEGTPKKSKYLLYARKGDKKPVVEFFFTTGQVVLPPSIHPDTGTQYKWVSQSLLEIDIDELPIINEEKIEHLQTVIWASSLQEGIKNIPTSITGDGSGKWKTITSEAARLLHLGIDDSTIAKTLVGMDRRLHSLSQFFFSPKIGKDLISKTDDFENALMWITTYKHSLMRTDQELRKTLSSVVKISESVNIHGEWDKPKPLIGSKKALEYPPYLFPRSAKKYCHQLSKMSNMPPEAYLASLMATFSAACQGKVYLHAKSDFVIHPSISVAVIAPSGSRKDTIFDGGKDPLMKLVNRDKDKLDGNFIENEKDIVSRLEILAKNKKKAISANESVDFVKEINKEIIELQTQLNASRKMRPNFIFESGSQERLYQVMHENQDRGIFLCNSEYVQLMGNLVRPGNESLRGFYLKTLNGSTKESFSHQTVGGVRVDIKKVVGNSLIGVQTDVFAKEIAAMESGKINDGLWQRFFLINVVPEIKRMEDIDEEIDSYEIDNKFALLYDHPGEIHVSWENKEAKDAYLDYDFMLNTRSQYDSSVVRSFRSKYSGKSIAVAWFFAQMDSPPGVIVTKISKKYFLMAVEWLEWQSVSLDITWSNNNYNTALRAANCILDYIKISGVSGDDFYRKCSSQTRLNITDMNAGISMLIDNNYVRRTGNKYEMNPCL